jgi:hypothetical protein
MEDKLICQEIVNNILKKYDKPIQNKKVRIVDKKNSKTYDIPIIDYIQICNRVLQNMNFASGGYVMNYLESIFDMYGMSKTACTGKVKITTIIYENKKDTIHHLYLNLDEELEIYKGLETPPNKIYKEDPMITFSKECFERIKKTTCKYNNNYSFTSLAIGNSITINYKNSQLAGAHSNILFILKNDKTNHIKLMLYEPHGYNFTDEITKKVNEYNILFVNDLVQYMEKIQNPYEKTYTFEFMTPREVSLSIGVQSFIGDERGYCALISSFWVYIVLGLLKSNLNPEYIFEKPDIIEKCLYVNYEKELYNIIVNFSVDVIQKYLPDIIGKEKTKQFINDSLVQTRHLYKKIKKELPPSRKYNVRKERLYEKINIGEQSKNGKNDCDTCTHERDCKSGNCVNGLCSPTHFYTSKRERSKITLLVGQKYKKEGNLPKKLNEECKYNNQCCSQKCIRNICTK